MSRRTPALIAAAVLLPLALTACSTPEGDEPTGNKAAAKSDGFPYTVTNCGVTTTFKAPPKRVVTMNQHVTEIMLELGLTKSLVGTAYLDDKVLPKYEKDYASVPVIAKEYPSYEQVLATNPDFVYGGYASAFAAGDGRGREALVKKSGIETRLNTESCAKADTPMETLYEEVREVGRTFGVTDRAEAWIKQAKADNAATAEKLKDLKALPVFVYDSGDKTAFTAGGKGIGNELIKRAGGTNIFADLDKSFGDASWENVVARKPEAIVIYDYGSTTVEQKKKRLLTDPALADVPAIKNKRFAVMPLSDAVLGVRVPAAVEKLAAQLHPAATTP
ncbi:Lipoprotein OS=Streptomyces microflavus OX=1919 GN=Smic_27920 PE=4 SV=1 [Streptomyces microflavus]